MGLIMTENDPPRRHAIKFIVRCDLVDLGMYPKPGRYPATICSPPNTFFLGLLKLIPHTAGGKRLCARVKFHTGADIQYRVGSAIYSARIAAQCKGGDIWLHAFDVASQLIRPDDNDPLVAQDNGPRRGGRGGQGAKPKEARHGG